MRFSIKKRRRPLRFCRSPLVAFEQTQQWLCRLIIVCSFNLVQVIPRNDNWSVFDFAIWWSLIHLQADDKQVRVTFSAVHLSSFFFLFLIFGKMFFSLHKQQSWLSKNINWFPGWSNLRNPRQHKRHCDVLLCPRNALVLSPGFSF